MIALLLGFATGIVFCGGGFAVVLATVHLWDRRAGR